MPEVDGPGDGGTSPYDIRSALLRTLLAVSPSPLHVLDGQLRVRWSRDPATEDASAGGTPAAGPHPGAAPAGPQAGAAPAGPAPIGRGFTEIYDVDDPDEVEARLRQLLDAGPGSGVAHSFRGRPRGAPAPDLAFTVRPLAPPAGHDGGSRQRPGGRTGARAPAAPALLVVVEDATGRDRARAQTAARTAVRERVGRSLDVGRTCGDLAEALVPGFADIAIVDLVDDVLRGAEPPEPPLGPETSLRCAAVRLAAAGPDTPCVEGGTRVVSLRTPQARALSDLEPRLVPVDGESAWLPAAPEHALAVRAAGAHSLLLVPLALRGAVLGVLSLYRCAGSPAYHPSDVATGAALGGRAALSLDNARRYARDHTIASIMQRHLLPQRDTHTLALDTAHAYLPGRNSGCWFDTIRLPGGRTALAVGEVAGQGIETAATMGQLRMVINALADLDLEPAELLARLENTATRLARERDAARDTGTRPLAQAHQVPLQASCLYGVFDPFSRTCVVAGAGDLVPLVVHPAGHVFTPDLPPGPPLGSGEPLPHAEVSVALYEGSVLAFRTGAFATPGGDARPPGAYDPAADYDAAAAYGLRPPDDGPGPAPAGAAHPAPHGPGADGDTGPAPGAGAAGATASADGDPVGLALARPGRSLRELCDAAVYALPPDGERDGAVLLLARALPLPEDRAATVELPDTPGASAEARTAARRVLGRWDADQDTVEAAELVVSELVTNAVRYGAPPVRLRLLHSDGTLTCEVHDTGTAAPHLRHARTADEGGRGLFIVSQLATRWGTRHTAAGKVLWTEQPLAHAARPATGGSGPEGVGRKSADLDS